MFSKQSFIPSQTALHGVYNSAHAMSASPQSNERAEPAEQRERLTIRLPPRKFVDLVMLTAMGVLDEEDFSDGIPMYEPELESEEEDQPRRIAGSKRVARRLASGSQPQPPPRPQPLQWHQQASVHLTEAGHSEAGNMDCGMGLETSIHQSPAATVVTGHPTHSASHTQLGHVGHEADNGECDVAMATEG